MQCEMNEMWGSSETQASALEKSRRFREAKFGLFIHWGLFAAHGNEWNGKVFSGISEWLMQREKISPEEYEKLAERFNPASFDATKLVDTAKRSGFHYIVFTAKHHEGFAMFRSSSPFNIFDATPFKRDPLAELSLACRDAGMPLGVYYSQNIDWHECADWAPRASFEDYFERKCLPQIKELSSNYGDIATFWFDCPGSMGSEQSMQIAQLVRQLQPKALINSRIGNGVGDYRSFGDNEIPLIPVEGPWEAINTMNNSWGYSKFDKNFLSSSEVIRQLVSVAGRGGNFLLNVGLNARGEISELEERVFAQTGAWLAKQGSAIYASEPSPWRLPFAWGDCTRRGDSIFLHVFAPTPGATIKLFDVPGEIAAASVHAEKGSVIEVVKRGRFTELRLPMESFEAPLVLELKLESLHLPSIREGVLLDDALRSTLPVACAESSGCKVEEALWMERFGEWKNAFLTKEWSPEGTLSWSVLVASPGYWRFSLKYASLEQTDWLLLTDEGETLRLFPHQNPQQGKRKRFHECACGALRFNASGERRVILKRASGEAAVDEFLEVVAEPWR